MRRARESKIRGWGREALPLLAPRRHDAVDNLQKVGGTKRLWQKFECRRPVVRARPAVPRHQDDWDPGERQLHRVGQVKAVDLARHDDVADNQVHRPSQPVYDAQRVLAALRFERAEVFALQNGTDIGANGGFVVNSKTDQLYRGPGVHN